MATRRSSFTNPAAKSVAKPPPAAPAQARSAEKSPVLPPANASPAAGKPVAPVRGQASPIHAPAVKSNSAPTAQAKPAAGDAPVTAAASEPPESQSSRLAKAALHRLVLEKTEPTPDNFARAYQREAGAEGASVLSERPKRLIEKLAARAFSSQKAGVGSDLAKAMAEGRWDAADRLLSAPDDSAAPWVDLMDRLVRGLERGGKQWTSARKKDSLQRVLSGSRGDAAKLQQRLGQLLTSWETDKPLGSAEPAETEASTATDPAHAVEALHGTRAASHHEASDFDAEKSALPQEPDGLVPAWNLSVGALGGSVEAALPAAEANSQRLAQAIHEATQRIQHDGISQPLADELASLCTEANRVVQHRHHLVNQLGSLCRELTLSLTQLTENDSWVQGQCEAMNQVIDDGLTARGVKAVTELLHHTREHQARVRGEREKARDALKVLINRMLSELSELGSQTGRFHESVGRYADVIDKADSLESLAGVVREMVEESRTVQSLVQQTQARLESEHSKADELSQRVTELETELIRLAQEVSTDQLTQIANRRGLIASFEIEQSRLERDGGVLCMGLLDIDNFKRLNDELGHSAGDEALKALAAVVSKTLRPTDMVARYGGEEFVVLLPNTPVDEGQQILTRLQRSLTGGLFLHEHKQIFVTFSAGVTVYRMGERIEDALERADQALYEAKRTGKNRTCIG